MSQILVRRGRAIGVRLHDNTEVLADAVLSNATPKVTFLDLLEAVRIMYGSNVSKSQYLVILCREH